MHNEDTHIGYKKINKKQTATKAFATRELTVNGTTVVLLLLQMIICYYEKVPKSKEIWHMNGGSVFVPDKLFVKQESNNIK